MKLSRISQLIYGRPLLITRNGFNVIHQLVQRKLNSDKMDPTDPMDPMEPMDEESDGYCMTIEKGRANIHICGPIGKKLSLLEKVCGACDIDVVREEIELALTHPDVEVIVFHVDSPGGSVAGVPELAEFITEANRLKKCIAIVDGMCCSAAYYLVAGCDEIISVGKTSSIGSIGVYCYLMDESRAYFNQGVDPVLIKAGDNKAEGLPGMPITQDVKDNLQKEVDYIYKLFTDHVKHNRRMVKEDSMQGRSYMSEEALQRGLIDYIVNTEDDVFDDEM